MTVPASTPTTVVELIRNLGEAPEWNGITFIDRRFVETFVPYRELFRAIVRQAERLHRQGLRPGQRAALSLANDLDVLSCFLGLVWLGAVPVSVHQPLVGQSQDGYVREIMRLARAHRLERVILGERLCEIARAAGELPSDYILSRELRPAGGEGTAAAPDHVEPAQVAPDDVAFVQFSSGSTSRPKGVLITHRNLLYNLRLQIDHDTRAAHHTALTWLPMCHDMGLVGGLMSSLYLPNRLVLMEPMCFLMRPVSWLSAISRHKVDGSHGPNFALDLCTKRIPDEALEKEAIDLSSFKYLALGGEPISPGAVARFVERFRRWGLDGLSIHAGYGMAEATLLVTLSPLHQGLHARRINGVELVSVGRPLGEIEVKVDKLRRLASDEEAGGKAASEGIGEILVRGPSISPGYLVEGELASNRLPDGWFATGDLGVVSDEGELFVTGRIKDLIIHRGRNFFGHDIACAVEALPEVASGKVHAFGVRLEDREAVVVMAVAERLTPPVSPADLGDKIRRHLMAEMGLAVDEVLIVNKIPKTTSGKVKRAECEEIYLRTRSAQ